MRAACAVYLMTQSDMRKMSALRYAAYMSALRRAPLFMRRYARCLMPRRDAMLR